MVVLPVVFAVTKLAIVVTIATIIVVAILEVTVLVVVTEAVLVTATTVTMLRAEEAKAKKRLAWGNLVGPIVVKWLARGNLVGPIVVKWLARGNLVGLVVVELLRGMLTADATKGLEGSDVLKSVIELLRRLRSVAHQGQQRFAGDDSTLNLYSKLTMCCAARANSVPSKLHIEG